MRNRCLFHLSALILAMTLIAPPVVQAQLPTDSGSCIEFDGGSWLQPARPFGFDLPHGYTVELWFYYPSGGPAFSSVMDRFPIRAHRSGKIEYWYGSTEAGLFSPDRWTHLAVTWDTSWGRLYIDGEEVHAVFSPGRVGENDEFLQIGGEDFVGFIDEFRIWDFAKTRGQILTQMRTPLIGDEGGLITYFPFDEGMGQMAKEVSGNEDDLQFGYTPSVDEADPKWAIKPIGRFGPPPSEEGQLFIDPEPIPCCGRLTIEVRDILESQDEAEVTVSSASTEDIENLILSEFPPDSGFFIGAIPLSSDSGSDNDGRLQVGGTGTTFVQYIELNDGTGEAQIHEATGHFDCSLPDWTPTWTPTSTETPTLTYSPTITPTPNPNPHIIHVDGSMPLSGSGLSWTDPMKTIQEALDLANGEDEIWIKSGTYEEMINLVDGVSLYGGFTGGETSIGQRPQSSESVIRWIYFQEAAHPGGYPQDYLDKIGEEGVVSAFNVHSATLDRLEISGGVATNGGGLHCEDSTLTIRDCTFENNVASEKGGGVYCSNSTLIFENCLWRMNSAYNFRPQSELAEGGGMCAESSEIAIRQSRFESNQAGGERYIRGGALFGRSSVFNLERLLFEVNSLKRLGSIYIVYSYDGSGVSLHESSEASIVNCLFVDNYREAAIHATGDSTARVIHTTIDGYDPSLKIDTNPESIVLNSIIMGDVHGRPNINYSWVRDWPTGEGNIADEYDLDIDRDSFRPATSASTVDAGTLTHVFIDYDGGHRPVDILGRGDDSTGTEYDMGAFEVPVEGYKGITLTPTRTPFSTRTPTPTFTPSRTPTCPQVDSYPATFTPAPLPGGVKKSIASSITDEPKSEMLTLYVDRLSPKGGDGKSRNRSHPSIQEAIDHAQGIPATILIRPGTYEEDILISGCEIHLLPDPIDEKGRTDTSNKVPADRIALQGHSIEIENSPSVTVSGFDIHRGGIKASKSVGEISDTTIRYNNRDSFPTGAEGGGLHVHRSYFTITSTIISDNWAFSGGGIFALWSKLTIRGCRIERNEVFGRERLEDEYSGYGTYIVRDPSQGGGICALGTSLDIQETSIVGNRASKYIGRHSQGGGIYFNSYGHYPRPFANIIGCDISDNECVEGIGSGFYVFDVRQEYFLVSRSRIGGNQGVATIFVEGADPIFDSVTFVDNEGCFFLKENAGPSVRNSILANNRADYGSILTVDDDPASLTFHNCTIVENDSLFPHQVIRFDGSIAPVEFINSILWGNGSLVDPRSIEYLTFRNSIVDSNIEGSNYERAYQSWPGFADYCAGDFHLAEGAFAIDKGNVAYIPEDVDRDIIGGPRVLGTSVDIGAVEFQSVAYNTPTFTPTYTPTPTLTPSITPTPTLTPTMLFDVVTDGHIDSRDLLQLIAEGTLKSGTDPIESALHFSVYWKRSR